ncbi:lipocalin-like domain-containing protein [Pyxidicoccus xibeiensis]|uniref:lipocalin-like domain-containing protein n=1 Tax=Pyxidicoccus xibeiensis TaxID=2906759 RepID=UPI0020A7F5CD|nr:lipocalin-like domain-containing protein [Pyxidicoccus xibeiensis]MCP3135947.1 lipocalin-like domain-containing protein [Pyxidicoccus xibeiensis]
MNRVHMRALAAVSLLLLAVLPSSSEAVARQKSFKEQLVGTWTLVLVDNVLPDGKRVQLYGAEPQGLLMFDGQGRYSIQILRAGRTRFASSDKNQGTPEENQATVRGANSHFGRYSVDEAERTITFHIDHASFPNWEGTEQRRTFTLTDDELKYTVPAPTTGGTGAVGEVKWRRAVTPASR